MTPSVRRLLFATLYRNRYLYRFASTVPFAGQWRVWQRQVLARLSGQEVLELGCGLGDLLADILEAGYTCHAVEQSPQMVAAARATLSRRHVGEAGLVIQGQAQSLPFSSETFDDVVSTFPAEYIHSIDTLAEIERVLRPGGRLLVVEGASLLPVGFFQPVLLVLQMLVYGWSGGERKRAKRVQAQGITTRVIANASFGRHIPLEQVGLKRRSELVSSPRWELYLTVGEKPEKAAV